MPAPLHCRNCGAKARHDTLVACMVYWRLKCRDAMRKNTAGDKRIKKLEAKLRGELERHSDRWHALLSVVEENTRAIDAIAERIEIRNFAQQAKFDIQGLPEMTITKSGEVFIETPTKARFNPVIGDPRD